MRDISRRSLISSVGAGALAGLAGCTGSDGQNNNTTTEDNNGGGGTTASPQTTTATPYPTETVDITVPYAAGGGFDAYARMTQPAWEQHLPNDPTVVVNNVTGGGGLIGIRQVFDAEPDGHRMGFTSTDNAVPIQIANDDLSFLDATPIGTLTSAPSVALLHEDVTAETWDELVDILPDINIATAGFGTAPHLLWVILGALTGEYDPDELNFVHYSGTGNLVGGLQRGESKALILGVGSGNSVAQALNVMREVFGFSTPDMSQHFVGDVTFSSELDVDGIDEFNTASSVNRFFFGPPGISSDVQDTMVNAFLEVVEDEDFLSAAKEAGRPVISPTGPEGLTETINRFADIYNQEPMLSVIQEAWSG